MTHLETFFSFTEKLKKKKEKKRKKTLLLTTVMTKPNFNNSESTPRYLQLSASPIPEQHHHHHQKKKRTKLMRIDNPIGFSITSNSTSTRKKPDPNAPKITRPCTECGKTFWSWKALFGHMRCHPERQWRGINPPPNLRSPILLQTHSESKMTREDHEIANCLLMLSNAPTSSGGGEVKREEEEHKCTICLRVFSSGEALRGHKRFHWEEEKLDEKQRGGGGGGGGAKEIIIGCGLDLNLPASLQLDDSYVYSSYCSSSGLALDLRLGI